LAQRSTHAFAIFQASLACYRIGQGHNDRAGTIPIRVKDRIMHRRTLLLSAGALTVLFAPPFVSGAKAANTAETFVSGNIQAGFDILNDQGIGPDARRQRFASFLLDLTDVRRVALFLLGRYAAAAAPADLDAYIAAYQDYVMALYQSYFARYAGQSLHVTASHERAPGDFVVSTNLVGANAAPMEIDFRIRTDGAKPVLVDLGVAGVWLALAQRDEFGAVLGQNNGDIKVLSAHLRAAQTR
jgi:phospholipid transport system substrate-binding protein